MEQTKIDKLIQACSAGRDIRKACLWAEITKEEFEDYCRGHIGFSDYLEGLRENPITEAYISVDKAIPTNPELALKVLERREKEVWSPRSELTGKDGEALKLITID